MKIEKILYALPVLLMLFSCKREKAIEPDKTLPEFQLPQGNHLYDSQIVDFYKKYGTYILYKFTEKDFRWNVTTLAPYLAEQADEDMVAEALDFMDDKLFKYYTEPLKKVLLPYKIILSSHIRTLGSGNPPIILETPVTATYTMSHIAFGHCHPRLLTLDATQVYLAKTDLHYALWLNAIQANRIDLPPVFITATNYALVTAGNKASHGVFNATASKAATLEADMADYIKLICSNSLTQLENTLFLKANDPNGKFRFKYDAIIKYYKEKYNVDLQEIGNAK